VYFTAWVEADGTMHFRDDIYGRDARGVADLTCPARAETTAAP
jgi:L,D-transpeptidase YcbB